jgi:GNAT superfamily N-acetyltransferase
VSAPTIRPAVESDRPALASLMAELGYSISLDDMRHNLQAVAASADDEILVAEVGGQVVGLIGIRIHLVIHRVGHVGEYTSMVVSASHRRLGIGQALVAAAEQWLSARGVTSFRVASNNRRKDEAHRFYTALGYEATHTMFRKYLAG